MLVPVSPELLKLINGTQNWDSFAADLQAVSWIGIRLVRNQALAEQSYRVDDVQLVGAGSDFADYIQALGGGGWSPELLPDADLDGDGSDNYSEWVAGTGANDDSDFFTVEAQRQANNAGFVVRWDAVAGRTYTVCRASEAGGTYTPVSGGLTTTGSEIAFEDATAVAGQKYFYKVFVSN